MKISAIFILAIIFSTAPLYSQQQELKLPLSKYGLPIVNDPEIYKQIVRANPDDQLFDMRELLPSAQFDVAYAGSNNDHKRPLYESADVFMRKPAALALVKVNEQLKKQGLGLIFYDGYRPYAVTVIFFERHPDTTYVADPRKGSRHNRGMAIDLSLIDLKSGKILSMPSAFDESSPRSFHSYMDADSASLAHREILKNAMLKEGFQIYPWEWWHYDYSGWEKCYTYDLKHSIIRKANKELKEEEK